MRTIKNTVLNVKPEYELLKGEIAGRLCYKSKSDYTLDSAKKFLEVIEKRNHLSVLEHINYVFLVTEDLYNSLKNDPLNKFMRFSVNQLKDGNIRYIVSCNRRTLIERKEDTNAIHLFRAVEDEGAPNEKATLIYNIDNPSFYEVRQHYTMTFFISCNRAIANEIVRHRKDCSYSQVSTRYVNYGKKDMAFTRSEEYNLLSKESQKIYDDMLEKAEESYTMLIKDGVKPEIARDILPLALNTEIAVTMTIGAVGHFLDLRSHHTAHPDIREITDQMNDLYELFLFDEIGYDNLPYESYLEDIAEMKNRIGDQIVDEEYFRSNVE